MSNEEFEQIVEKTIKTTANDVASATDISKRETAMKNFKTATDILLEHRKMEYTHEENQNRIENEREKIKRDDAHFKTETDLKYEQLENDARNKKQEAITKAIMYGVKVALLIGAETMALKFETGGNWTSSLGRTLFPAFGRTIVDDVTKF